MRRKDFEACVKELANLPRQYKPYVDPRLYGGAVRFWWGVCKLCPAFAALHAKTDKLPREISNGDIALSFIAEQLGWREEATVDIFGASDYKHHPRRAELLHGLNLQEIAPSSATVDQKSASLTHEAGMLVKQWGEDMNVLFRSFGKSRLETEEVVAILSPHVSALVDDLSSFLRVRIPS